MLLIILLRIGVLIVSISFNEIAVRKGHLTQVSGAFALWVSAFHIRMTVPYPPLRIIPYRVSCNLHVTLSPLAESIFSWSKFFPAFDAPPSTLGSYIPMTFYMFARHIIYPMWDYNNTSRTPAHLLRARIGVYANDVRSVCVDRYYKVKHRLSFGYPFHSSI